MNSFDKFLSSIAIEGSVADNVALESDLMDAALESIFSKHREAKASKAALQPEFENPSAVIRYLSNPAKIANGFKLAKGSDVEARQQSLLNEYTKSPGKGKLKTRSEMKKVGGYPVILTYDMSGALKMYSVVLEKDGHQQDDVITLNSYYNIKKRNDDLPE